MLVVLLVLAIVSASVSLSLPDPQAHALDREALRLQALLETARAQARAQGAVVHWRADANGFEFLGATASTDPDASLVGHRPWLTPGTQAHIVAPTNTQTLVLGPEPLLPAQTLTLSLGAQSLTLRSDGLRPFMQPTTTDAP